MSMALGALRNGRCSRRQPRLLDEPRRQGDADRGDAAGHPVDDLAYSLTPNGHTLDYVADAPYLARNRIGVMKQSFVAGSTRSGRRRATIARPAPIPTPT
jgi:hypothetical protein